MSKEAIVNRIISDAEQEARAIIAKAEENAEKTLLSARESGERMLAGTKAEIAERSRAISDGKAAAARLDSAKIRLSEKRRVIDTVYLRAAKKLAYLDEKQSLKLVESLLSKYAEEGDEIVLAKNFPFADGVKKLKPVAEKKLKISPERVMMDGGFILRGKVCDKDVSYGALLAADREQNEGKLSERLFKQ